MHLFQVDARLCAEDERFTHGQIGDRNRANAEIVSSERSAVRVFVIRTNEELTIARHTAELMAQRVAAVPRGV